MKFLSKSNQQPSVLEILGEVKGQQERLVQAITNGQDENDKRASTILSDIGAHVEKLEAVIDRLASLAEVLVEHHENEDQRIKPWYVRIFCPW